MAIRKRGLLAMPITLVVIACAMLASLAQSASAAVTCPSGGNSAAHIDTWRTLWPTRGANDKGVALCEGVGGITNNVRGYLQIADLGDGAKIRLHADVDPESPENISDTLYRKRFAEDWFDWLRGFRAEEEWPNWGYVQPESTRLFSATSGTFFTRTENEVETTVPFPLYTMNGMDSFGVSWRRAHPEEMEETLSDEDYDAPKKVLKVGNTGLWEGVQQVQVGSFRTHYEFEDIERLTEEEIADAAVSFTAGHVVGESEVRNYVGTYGDRVYIWVSDDRYTNSETISIMNEIQSGMELIQMDGGGSAQFYSDYGEKESWIPFGEREVANVIAIYRAP